MRPGPPAQVGGTSSTRLRSTMSASTFTTRPELTGDLGMVASTHWLASGAGMSVLERGGNAADAAVAAAFVLHVVEPHLNGPGGEVPILLWDPADEQVRVLAGQGVMPADATIDRYTSLGLELVPGTGLLPAAVPGAVGAWLLLLERWGTWELADVLAPAIAYAENGWPVSPGVTDALAAVEDLFRRDWPTSAATWLGSAGVPRPGSRARNPVLAATWRRLLRESAGGASREGRIAAARDAFYSGFVAAAIDEHVRTPVLDASGERHAGVLTAQDLYRWQCPVEDPVGLDYHGYTVFKTGPWGQGPVFLQQLALLDGYDLQAAGFLTADYVHTVVECAKLAFADREAWYGDPHAVDVPLDHLLSETYSKERRALITPDASYELRPGSPGGRQPRMAAALGAARRTVAAGAGEPTVDTSGRTRGDTCHVDVIDRDGLMISATPSGGWLQSSPVVEELGFCLGTRGQMTWLEPGLPTSLRPGLRPRTTLTPSLALREGRPYLAFGTPGGDQQDQWSLLFFLAHVHFGLNLQAAIDAPAFHSEHMPSSFWPRESHPGSLVVEGRLAADVVSKLRRQGHDVSVSDDWSLGRVSAAGPDPDTGFLRAAANARGGLGYAVGR